MTVYVNRPMISYWGNLKYSDKYLDQQIKLVKNHLVTLDLSNPHFKLRAYRNKTLTSGERYKDWVDGWKENYTALSAIQRALKDQRSFQGTGQIVADLIKANPGWHNLIPAELHSTNHARVSAAILKFKELAQQMLNARRNGKFASAECWRRENTKVSEIVAVAE